MSVLTKEPLNIYPSKTSFEKHSLILDITRKDAG